MTKCARCSVEKDATLFTESGKVFKQCAACRKKGRARFKLAWKRDPKKVQARVKRWRRENPEKQREIRRRHGVLWRRRYPHKKAAKNKEYARRNKGKKTAQTRAYQLRKARAMPKWADPQAIELIYLLARQLREEGYEVQVDHVYPLRGQDVCGLHVAENLQIVPSRYNTRKSNKVRPDKIAA